MGDRSVQLVPNLAFEDLLDLRSCLVTGQDMPRPEPAVADGQPVEAQDFTSVPIAVSGVYVCAPWMWLDELGGQDTKVIRMGAQGDVRDFSMNDKCAGGTGAVTFTSSSNTTTNLYGGSPAKWRDHKFGGTSETTTTLNLAALLARRGRAPLVIDLDPQTNASIMVAGPDRWNAMRESERTLDFYFESYIVTEPGLTPLEKFQLLTEDELLDALLDPPALLGVLDVHVLDADGAAVRVAQDAEDLAQRQERLAAEATGREGAVEVPQGEAVLEDVEVRVHQHQRGDVDDLRRHPVLAQPLPQREEADGIHLEGRRGQHQIARRPV